jgi:hypothetical protein
MQLINELFLLMRELPERMHELFLLIDQLF